MLSIILKSLESFDSEIIGVNSTSDDRFIKGKDYFKNNLFSRKEYMELFKSISSATASRDLKEGIVKKILTSNGERNQTRYRFI